MNRTVVAVAVLTFSISAILALAYDNVHRSELEALNWAHAQHEGDILHAQLQQVLYQSNLAMEGMTRTLSLNPALAPEAFFENAAWHLTDGGAVVAVFWLPVSGKDNIYSREESIAARLSELRQTAEQRHIEERVREEKQPQTIVFDAAKEIIVVYAPVFSRMQVDQSGDGYRGLMGIVLPAEKLQQLSTPKHFSMITNGSLRMQPFGSPDRVLLYGDQGVFAQDKAIVHNLIALGATWQLTVLESPQDMRFDSLLLGRGISVVLVAMMTWLMSTLVQNHMNRIRSEERQRHEKEFIDSVVDTVGTVICVLNQRGEIVRFNHQAEVVTGYSATELLGKFIWDYLIPDEQVEAVKGVFGNLLAGNFPSNYVNHWKTKDNQLRLLSWSNTALLDSSGGVEFVVATGIDITESERHEREKIQLQRQLLQAQKMEALGQLTGGVAHDFNNILAAIMGNAELATMKLSQNAQENVANYLSEISRSAERAKKLILQMLAFSRGEQLPANSVSLPLVFEQFIALLHSMLPATIELSVSCADEELPQVRADENQLEQVLLNLVINARDAVAGRGRISITASMLEGKSICSSCHDTISGAYAVVTVADSAGALDPQLVDKIFDPFFTTKAVGKGSGMGLSMVHGIVHGWGGHIVVRVEPGCRTAFELYLPIAATP